MNKKTQGNGAVVMLYTGNIKKEKKIAAFLREKGLNIRYIKQGDINKPLNIILGNAGKSGHLKMEEKSPLNYKLPEIIIFSGLSQEELYKLLDEYKDSGLEPVELKAVITPVNITWSLYRLILELEREREEFK